MTTDTAAADTITEERLADLLADQTIPSAHRALWALLWDGDIRVSEALSMDVRDIDLAARTAIVEFRAKPDDTVVPVSERAAELLREAFAGETAGPALHLSGRPISRHGAVLKARANGYSIHAFRSSGRARRLGALET
ncbi:tyrosine-type recombinase/integrase [Streptomyces sp. NPDC003656]